MKRIKVNADADNIGVVALFILGVALLAFCVWIAYTDGFDADVIEGIVISLLILFAFLRFFSAKSKDEYVSDLLVSKTALTLIYRYKNNKRQVVISTKDIKRVKADFVDTKTTVDILKNDGEHITFEDYLGKSVSLCYHKFLLDLISVSEYLPNFIYNVLTSNQALKEDVEHFRIHRKRRTFFEILKKELAKWSIFTKILIFFIACLFILLLSIAVCPPLMDVLIK